MKKQRLREVRLESLLKVIAHEWWFGNLILLTNPSSFFSIMLPPKNELESSFNHPCPRLSSPQKIRMSSVKKGSTILRDKGQSGKRLFKRSISWSLPTFTIREFLTMFILSYFYWNLNPSILVMSENAKSRAFSWRSWRVGDFTVNWRGQEEVGMRRWVINR